MDLQEKNKQYKFHSIPNSFECIEEQKQIIAGCQNGRIQRLKGTEKTLLPEKIEDLLPGEQFINDLTFIRPNLLANCYNNGTIALWNLTQNKLVHKIKQVHERYTYKLRQIDNQKLLSCGNDGYACVSDLYKGKKITSLKHPSPVWCSYPLTKDVISSVGLFGRILFWDLRTKNIIQNCILTGNESSFITKYDENNLVFGDERQIARCDMRKMSSIILSKNFMTASAECIIINEDKSGFVCGRGREICKFISTDEDVPITIKKDKSSNFFQIFEPISNLQFDIQVQDDQLEVDEQDIDINNSSEQIQEEESQQQSNEPLINLDSQSDDDTL